MRENRPSQTAIGVAHLRAAHQLVDPAPLVFEDPLAVTVLGAGARERILDEPERYHAVGPRALRAHVVLRSRFTEDRLAEAVGRGVAQYVVLGAGLDTFAFRQPAWSATLRIFEIDHVDTQQFKQSMLADAMITTPPNVTFGAIDFEHESLTDGLQRIGVRSDVPTFFSWLGVTMYLPTAAIESALQAMAAFPAGSEVVLTFMQPPDEYELTATRYTTALAAAAAAAGEPFVSYLRPEDVEAMLRAAGFTSVSILDADDARARYFATADALPAPRRSSLAFAVR